MKTASAERPRPAASAEPATPAPPAWPPARAPWWLWPHLLSLDAPLVALVWQGWWARATGTVLRPGHAAVLGLAVWLIYLADRVADARRASPGEQAAARHAFAGRRHRGLLVLAVLVAGALVVSAPGLLPAGHFLGGLGLLTAAGGYFWLIHRRRSQGWAAYLPKEAVVGGMFALGSAFFVLCRRTAPAAALALAVAGFGVVCFLNCALITTWERNAADRRDPASLLNAFPRLAAAGLRPLAWTLAAGGLAAGGWTHSALGLPVALAALALGGLDRCRDRLGRDALRVLADAVLLTPWVCEAIFPAAR